MVDLKNWEIKQIEDAVDALDNLPKGLTETISEMARRGDLGFTAALTALPSNALDFDEFAFLTDPVSEIVRDAEWLMRPEHSFFEDIRLTEQFLASADVVPFLEKFGTPFMANFIAEFDRFGAIAQRVFETYSITPEQLGLEIGSLDQPQLDLLVRQAATQLWKEVELRGWTSPAEQSLDAQVDSADEDEHPQEFDEEPDDVSAENVAAVRRLARSPKVMYRILAWIVATTVVPVSLHMVASRSQTIAHDDMMEAHGEALQARAEQLKRQSEMLDVLGESRDAQIEISNLLRRILGASTDSLEEPGDDQDFSDSPEQNGRTRLRPVADRRTPIGELIEQAAETHREALEILAKR